MSTSRKTLLAGVSAAAFTLVIGGAAFAADVTVPTTTGTTSTVSGHVALSDLLVNTDSSTTATELTSGASGTVTGTGNTVSVDTNVLGAVTIGNSVIDTVDFNTTSSGTGTSTGSGIGILSMGLNTDRLFTATTSGSFDTNAINGGATGTYTVDTNTTEASTTLNTATITVTPTGVPLNFASESTGTIATQYPTSNIIATTGDITAVNSQGNLASIDASDSQSLLSANTATLKVGQASATTGDVGIGGTEDISGNTLSATFAGNSATTAAGASSGDLPSLQGSISVANVQANYDAGAGATGGQADATGTTVEALISGNANTSGTNATETLTGTLTANNNTISASTTGNSAALTSGTTTSGNTITLSGVNYANPAGQTEANTITYPGAGITTTTDGGLALLNSQTEETTTGTSALGSTNNASHILSVVQNATTATSELDGNSITSSTSADAAYNAITVGGVGTDTINGSATLGSAQEANHVLLSATTSGGVLVSSVGDAAAPNDIVTGTDVSVGGNTVSATTYGASVSNGLTLDANSVTTGTTTSALTGQRSSLAAETFSASNTGATINNVQTVFGSNSTITATNSETSGTPTIALYAGDNTDALTGDTLTVTGNSVEAIAAGASGGSAASIGGVGGQASSFSGGLGVLNAQGNEAAVTATLTNAATDLLAGIGGANVGNGTTGVGSTLSDSTNVLRSLAYGNQAIGNTASVDAGTITVPADAEASTTLTVTPGNALGLLFDSSTGVTANGGVAVFSDQADTNNVEASTTTVGNPVSTFVGGSVLDSEATADSNAFLSAARGNAATNGVTLTGDSITTAGAAYGPLATVANVQELGVGVTVSSLTDSSSTGLPTGTPDATIELDIVGSLSGNLAGNTGSSADTSSNTIEALTVGNTSSNSLSATAGSSITANFTGLVTATSGATYDAGVLTNEAAFSVTNAQGSGTGGARDATLSNLGVHIDVGGSVVASSATANTNQVIASATDNDATSSLTLDPPSIQATAAVQNLQLSNASLDVTKGKAGTAASPGTPGTTEPVGEFNVPGNVTISLAGSTITITGSAVTFSETGFASDAAFAQYATLFGKTPTGTSGSETFTVAGGGATYTNAAFASLTPGTLYVNATGTPASGGLPSFTYGGTAPTAATPGTGIIITVAHAITGSTLNNNNNAFSGSATGNNAVNTLSVTAGNASNAAGAVPQASQGALSTAAGDSATGDFALQNEQTKSNTISATSNATNSIIDTTNEVAGVDNTTNSTLTVNGNSNQAAAQGNVATNTVSLAVANSTGVTASLLSNQSSSSATNAAIADATVSSNLLVGDSTVQEMTNTNLALATNNTATNSLSAGGAGASLGSGYGGPALSGGAANAGWDTATPEVGASADYAVANIQSSTGTTVSTTATQSVGNSDVSGTGGGLTDGSVYGSTVTLSSNSNSAQSTVNLATSSLTLNPSASLSADAGLVNYQTSSTAATSGAGTSVSFEEPNVQTSTIAINSNTSSAEALGNVATSSVNASATDIQLTGAILVDAGTQDVTGGQTGALADYALANSQSSTGAMTAVGTALFSISETAPTAGATVETSNSELEVNSNIAQAAAEGNSTTNSLTIAAAADAVDGTTPTHAPTGALLSVQSAAGAISSNSTETATITGIVTLSTVDASSNSNLALSLGNDATNTLDASAVNYSSAGNLAPLGNIQAKAGVGSVSADLSLENDQSQLTGSVGATASTTIDQSDTTTTTAAVNQSTVTFDSNTTTADSTVNRASNTLSLSATNTGALAGISNSQDSAVNSTAAATAVISYAEPSSTSSTIALDSNSSTAQATGNSASNALNASASANYTIPTGSYGFTNNATPAAWGQYAVLNDQANTAAVSSTNTTSVSVALNGTTGAGVVSNSTVSASNNMVLAESTGNAATNSIALSAAVTGTAPTGLSSIQSNVGAGTSISATVSGSFVGVAAGVPGTATGSTIGVNSNTMVARSTGNSVVNTITAK